MRAMGGWGKEQKNYFLKRAAPLIPESLESTVFPWADTWWKRYVKAFGPQRASFAEGGIDDPDISGKSFLEVVLFLRRVLLQDCAVLQRDYPNHPLWVAPVFSHFQWRDYADAVLAAHDVPDSPIDIQKIQCHWLRSILPRRGTILPL